MARTTRERISQKVKQKQQEEEEKKRAEEQQQQLYQQRLQQQQAEEKKRHEMRERERHKAKTLGGAAGAGDVSSTEGRSENVIFFLAVLTKIDQELRSLYLRMGDFFLGNVFWLSETFDPWCSHHIWCSYIIQSVAMISRQSVICKFVGIIFDHAE